MFCPQCGSQQSDEMRFCKVCGANLQAVLQSLASRETDDKFDWSKTWVAEMFMSGSQRKLYEAELERQRGITPEMKRYTEVKAGVITGCVGLALMIFLNVLMQGIILSGQIGPGEEHILSRIWVAGIIPFFVGIALIINGLVVSKRIAELAKKNLPLPGANTFENSVEAQQSRPAALRSADTSQFIPANFSVTEDPTKHFTDRRQTAGQDPH